MWGSSPVFPGTPEAAGREERRSIQLLRRQYETRLGRLASRADWLAEMWSEFPDVAARHRYYASALRSASATLWLAPPSPSAVQSQIRLRLRRLAWRAYRQAAAPTPPGAAPEALRAAQRQKVDAYWARQFWASIGEDRIRKSVLDAREYELQQLCDSLPDRNATPRLFHLLLFILKWLSPWRR